MAKKRKSFEQSIEELRRIVETIEDGDLELDKAVKLYKEGIELSLYCSGFLKSIENEVTVLKQMADGAFDEVIFNVEGK